LPKVSAKKRESKAARDEANAIKATQSAQKKAAGGEEKKKRAAPGQSERAKVNYLSRS
jgi:hypothetical protein